MVCVCLPCQYSLVSLLVTVLLTFHNLYVLPSILLPIARYSVPVTKKINCKTQYLAVKFHTVATRTHQSSSFHALLTCSRIYVLIANRTQMDTKQNVVTTIITPDLSSPLIANGGGCMIAVLFGCTTSSLIADNNDSPSTGLE